jgi:hypothetical protein
MRILFGLRELGWGEEDVHLAFARPLPGWAWVLIVLAAGLLSWWSYWRLEGPSRGRMVLAGVRASMLVLLALVISGPRLVRPNIVVEPDWVIVLVDRSASMGIRDVGDGPRRTREEQLEGVLESSWPMWSSLSEERRVVWLGFDAGAYDLEMETDADDETVGVDLGEPDGQRTSLASALDQAMRRAAARPVSAVVVLSDGRSVDRPSRQAMRRLEAEQIPVFSVALGRADALADLAIDRVRSPRVAFVDDTIPIDVRVARHGGGDWPPARVQLVDAPTGLVLDERALEPAREPGAPPGETASVMLRARPDEAGERSWAVRIVTDEPDLIETNNELALAIELVDRPLRVLYLDGYPRWEQRYVETLLLREKSIESASMMVASNRRYTQEGDRLLDAVPRSPEEWADFDVVVVGDVRSDLFSAEQLEQLREHVAVRGAGLLWIAGPGATPSSWRGTALADLIPFRMGEGRGQAVNAYAEPVTLIRTEASERLGLLDMSDDDEGGWPELLSDPRTGWSRLWYAQRIEDAALKPAAEVLARAVPGSAWRRSLIEEPASTPLVVSMRYGAGRVIYVGTDEIWRWRFGRGETLPERFWLPLIRLQGRESLARGGAPALLEASPRRAVVGEPIRIAIRLLDESLLETRPRGMTVRIRGVDSEESPELELMLSRDDTGGERLGQVYSATWLAPGAGRYSIEASDAMLAAMDLRTEVEVSRSDDELRRPETDHAMLVSLSEATDGRVLIGSDLAQLPELLPRRRMEIASEPDVETLWDKPIVLAILVLLLGVEWVGRRLARLS